MKEEYLHQIWHTKRLPMHRLQTIDGNSLTVKNVGWHNHASGPDFFNGSIELEGITWSGNIEIHIRSSDWYAHKHDTDEAYENVILHVVYEYDRPVFIQGRAIPTLELKSLLDQQHWSSYNTLMKNTAWIPCKNQIATVDSVFVNSQIENALVQRLERRAQIIENRFQLLGRDLQQLQYELLAEAFGSKVNALPFIELTKRMPIKTIWREGTEQALALLLGAAGLMESDNGIPGRLHKDWVFLKRKHGFESMNKFSWKWKGVRPKGYPQLRVYQFAMIIREMRSDFSFFERAPTELLSFFNYSLPGSNYSLLATSFQELILINAVVPLLWWYGNYRENSFYKEKALELLEQLQPEKNEIINTWKSMGIKMKSALDSQGLLELKNEICNFRKCLSCKIGHKILDDGEQRYQKNSTKDYFLF